MAIWTYYPQSSLVEAATLTDLTGTAIYRNNCLNYRYRSRLDVVTVSSSEYAMKIDLGSGNVLNPDYFAIADHNLYDETAVASLYCGNAVDDGTTFDRLLGQRTLTSADQPILIVVTSTGYEKRYFKLSITSIAVTAYFGVFFMGNAIAPSINPNYGQPQEYDRSGTALHESDAGAVIGHSKFGRKRIWPVVYEDLGDTDKDKICSATGLEYVVGGPRKPFFFTDQNSVRYYGRLNGNVRATENFASIWRTEFTIREDI